VAGGGLSVLLRLCGCRCPIERDGSDGFISIDSEARRLVESAIRKYDFVRDLILSSYLELVVTGGSYLRVLPSASASASASAVDNLSSAHFDVEWVISESHSSSQTGMRPMVTVAVGRSSVDGLQDDARPSWRMSSAVLISRCPSLKDAVHSHISNIRASEVPEVSSLLRLQYSGCIESLNALMQFICCGYFSPHYLPPASGSSSSTALASGPSSAVQTPSSSIQSLPHRHYGHSSSASGSSSAGFIPSPSPVAQVYLELAVAANELGMVGLKVIALEALTASLSDRNVVEIELLARSQGEK
jgi:hypothetical protein